ncbi:MAG: hypothetical protein HY557_01780 [Euryarchaeota archaeon]|nr:hypothetical protein [Euryarchaeota archaeon]
MRKRDFDVITLLSEAHPDYPDARAAARVIETIDKLLLHTELDVPERVVDGVHVPVQRLGHGEVAEDRVLAQEAAGDEEAGGVSGASRGPTWPVVPIRARARAAK